jgi:glutaconate CoA-transferase subunit B
MVGKGASRLTDPRLAERLIVAAANLLKDCRHVAVGARSPIPAGAALLARALSGGAMRVSLLGSLRDNMFTNGGVELFDCAAQGRIDAFFLGGGEIDGQGNVNLLGLGGHPGTSVRWPGCFGSTYLYHHVPRVILFREEHDSRILVRRVEFVSAAGPRATDPTRRGGPSALLTGMALFSFNRDRHRFCLESVHEGHRAEEIVAATGFDFDLPAKVPATPAPEAAILDLLRGKVREELRAVYPRFAATLPTPTG